MYIIRISSTTLCDVCLISVFFFFFFHLEKIWNMAFGVHPRNILFFISFLLFVLLFLFNKQTKENNSNNCKYVNPLLFLLMLSRYFKLGLPILNWAFRPILSG